MIDQAMILRQKLGPSNINFDVGKFNWVGRLTNNTPIMITWHESPIKNAKDLLEKQAILFGALSARLDYTFLKQLLGAKIKVVPGYKSTSEAFLAMQRGEIHGMQMPWPVVLSKHGHLVKEKKIIPILQAGVEKAENLPNVPRMIDIAKSEHDRKLFEFISQASAIGRSVVAPPGLSSDVLAMLRKAFSETVQDPKFLSEAQRAKLTLGLLSGEQLATLIERNSKYPTSIVEEATRIAKEAGLIR
jgi:tripartite-type tricarboxylate transporter receptor subunit TctC